MSKPLLFGEIPGINEGDIFESRNEIKNLGGHRNTQKGIDGNRHEGAAAIVLSGGYKDDIDQGLEILYTGSGGRNDKKVLIKDQTWENNDNASLISSMNLGKPIRVFRGAKHNSEFSPKIGYQYAGLYSIVDAFEDIGENGFKICRFKLIYSGTTRSKINSLFLFESHLDDKNLYNSKVPTRTETTILRIVRDSKIGNRVKQLYSNFCQVCNERIKVKNGYYAEGAHIRPLGIPHHGIDSLDNILCLCPNHHIMFDRGTISISPEFNIIGEINSPLIINSDHIINIENLLYHNKIHGF